MHYVVKLSILVLRGYTCDFRLVDWLCNLRNQQKYFRWAL